MVVGLCRNDAAVSSELIIIFWSYPVQVMERLMSVSSDYWSQFINIDADGTRDFGTPRLSEGIMYACSC